MADPPTSRRAVWALVLGSVAVVALVSVGAAMAWFPGHAGAPWGGPPPPGSGPTAYVNLTIGSAPGSGLDQVSPANFTVPHGERIVLKVTNFDTGVNPPASMWSRVMGTYYGTETIALGSGTPTTISWLSPYEVSHTLTLLPSGWSFWGSMMNGTGMGGAGPGMMGTMMVNLPIPAAPNASTPTVVVASFYFATSGTYAWYCEAPCDATAMATPGYMRGTVTVL